ncbi:MFS transporter [candidate division KSB1 bacterium]
MIQQSRKKQVRSWILYDFANTIFSMCVVTFYFSPWMVEDLGKGDIWYSAGTSLSMLLVAWTLPFLGEVTDRYNKKGRMLHVMTIICVVSTCFMSLGAALSDSLMVTAVLGLIFFVIANYAYQGALVFYNAYLPDITTSGNYGKISGWGVSMGYVGAIVGIILVSPFYDGMIFNWEVPGIAGWGRAATFAPAGILFLLFALPVFLHLRDNSNTAAPKGSVSIARPRSLLFPFTDYIRTARDLKLLRFLAAKFFYEECIETVIIVMNVYLISVFGFTQSEQIFFFVMVIPAAVIGAAICGYFVDRFGPKTTLLVVLGGWIATLIMTIITTDRTYIWLIGCLTGIFLGSKDTSARPLFITLSPPERLNECFGLYAFSGKAAAIVGPLVWGILVTFVFAGYGDVTRYKTGIGALLVFMIIGFVILLGVKPQSEETSR